MFQPGQVLKVKVETSPGEFGFGRATIIDRAGNNILVQIKTAREDNRKLGKGTKLWFVNDSPRLTFNGMWMSSILGTQIVKGRTCLVCALPKLQPLKQRRTSQRVAVDVPVTISLDIEGKEKLEYRTVDLCKSGSAIETTRLDPRAVDVGKELGAVLHMPEGDVKLKARVIRVEQNWLANKTTLALEFIALPKESSDILDQLLVKLGGDPRQGDEPAGKQDTMRGWASQIRLDTTEIEREALNSVIKKKDNSDSAAEIEEEPDE